MLWLWEPEPMRSSEQVRLPGAQREPLSSEVATVRWVVALKSEEVKVPLALEAPWWSVGATALARGEVSSRVLEALLGALGGLSPSMLGTALPGEAPLQFPGVMAVVEGR